MDYRRVDPDFRRCAGVLQLCLCVGFVLYVVYEGWKICVGKPPVEVRTEGWTGAGKWAVCEHASYGGSVLHAAGFGLLRGRYIGAASISSVDKAAAAWELSKEEVTLENWQLTCSVVDLTEWTPPQIPGLFAMCLDAAHSFLLVQSHGVWSVAADGGTNDLIIIRASKRRHGQSYLFSESLTDSFETSVVASAPGYGQQRTDQVCEMTQLTPGTAGPSAAYIISVEEPIVNVTLELGTWPQVVRLIGGLGGYVTVLTLIFTTIFVKKYPQCDIAVKFEMRTLFGHSVGQSGSSPNANGNRPEEGSSASSLQDQIIGVVVDENSSTTARSGIAQRHDSQFPRFPPGIKMTE